MGDANRGLHDLLLDAARRAETDVRPLAATEIRRRGVRRRQHRTMATVAATAVVLAGAGGVAAAALTSPRSHSQVATTTTGPSLSASPPPPSSSATGSVRAATVPPSTRPSTSKHTRTPSPTAAHRSAPSTSTSASTSTPRSPAPSTTIAPPGVPLSNALLAPSELPGDALQAEPTGARWRTVSGDQGMAQVDICLPSAATADLSRYYDVSPSSAVSGHEMVWRLPDAQQAQSLLAQVVTHVSSCPVTSATAEPPTPTTMQSDLPRDGIGDEARTWTIGADFGTTPHALTIQSVSVVRTGRVVGLLAWQYVGNGTLGQQADEETLKALAQRLGTVG